MRIRHRPFHHQPRRKWPRQECLCKPASSNHNIDSSRNPQTRRQTAMAKLQAQVLLREFNYNGVRIPDPAPQMSVEEVRDLLVPSYPELATATLTGPEDTGTTL